jgi:ABC-type glycerol-3-phosphate transport system substrate-binding protein
MFLTGSWWLVQCRQSKTLDWDIAPMPIGPLTRTTRCTTEGLAISPQSKYKAEGWEWIKFVLSDEGQAVFARHGRGAPSVRRVAATLFPDPRTPQHEERFLEALDNYCRIGSLHSRWNETEAVFNREWDRVAMKQSTIDDFIRIALPEANAIVRGENS